MVQGGGWVNLWRVGGVGGGVGESGPVGECVVSLSNPDRSLHTAGPKRAPEPQRVWEGHSGRGQPRG